MKYEILALDPEIVSTETVERFKGFLPENMGECLFANNAKWFAIDSYKFGEPTVTEKHLNRLIDEGQIFAYAYVMYEPEERTKLRLTCISFRIIFGVVENVINSIDTFLRVHYVNAVRIKSPMDLDPNAPAIEIVAHRRPRIWIAGVKDQRCDRCGLPMFYFKRFTNRKNKKAEDETASCNNENCENFKYPSVTLNCFDFKTGPRVRPSLIVNVFDDHDATTAPREMFADVTICPRCASCRNCKKMLSKFSRRCNMHKICMHKSNDKSKRIQ